MAGHIHVAEQRHNECLYRLSSRLGIFGHIRLYLLYNYDKEKISRRKPRIGSLNKKILPFGRIFLFCISFDDGFNSIYAILSFCIVSFSIDKTEMLCYNVHIIY